ncbi:MAG TPA: serine hydrolase [Candidatus Paceibacterota bacterium]|nr:serine hydrolase [Candidatus Paceibacterota bacterium]
MAKIGLLRLDKEKIMLPIALAFVGGILVGVCSVLLIKPFSSPSLRIVRQSDIATSSEYRFTDPLISVSVTGDNPGPEYVNLNNQLTAYINQQERVGSLTSASVYFRDIDASSGLTINPTMTYDPASLTKVPLAMAYYDLAENDPSVLSDEITYSGVPNLDADEQVKSPIQLTAHTNYSVETLLEHMIKYSDNNAEQLLADHLATIGKLDTLATLFTDLGIKIDPNDPDYMSVRTYAILLRVLYNATYLDRGYSEQMLDILSQSDFTAGIAVRLPSDVVVAHKFGEARIPDSQGAIVGAELHDCGIVYYPDHPYILCIMTKGPSIADLEQVIQHSSQITFTAVQNHYAPTLIPTKP